jgi:hypothetical protein
MSKEVGRLDQMQIVFTVSRRCKADDDVSAVVPRSNSFAVDDLEKAQVRLAGGWLPTE